MTFRDEFIANLPSDPGDALIVLADRAQDWLQSDHRGDDGVEALYIRTIFQRFLDRYNIEVDVYNSTGEDLPSIHDYIRAITKFSGSRVVDQLLDKYDVERGDPQYGTAILDSSEKDEVHSHISAIRRIIEESTLDTRKKNALFGRLNDLAIEVDRIGTKTDRFFSFMADLGFALGEFGNNAKPLIEEVRGMIKTISRARARQEGVSLPSDDEPLKLPTPSASD